MGTIVLPQPVRRVVHAVMGICSVCYGAEGLTDVQDRRYKQKAVGRVCAVYRASHTSVTVKCRNCGAKHTMTWRSMAESLVKLVDKEVEHMPENAALLDRWVDILDENVDTQYSHRKPPITN